jgi:hypothetical protein
MPAIWLPMPKRSCPPLGTHHQHGHPNSERRSRNPEHGGTRHRGFAIADAPQTLIHTVGPHGNWRGKSGSVRDALTQTGLERGFLGHR